MTKRFTPAASAVLMASVLASPAVLAEQAITVGIFGGNWGTAFTECIATPFVEETGITVTPEIGTSTVNLSKVQQQTGAQVIDVLWMDGGVSEVAMTAGVLDTLNPEHIPNMRNLMPQAVYDVDNQPFAVSTGFYAFGIAYNSDEISAAPTSWQDLWRPEYERMVTFPAPANALGVPTVTHLADILHAGDNDAMFTQLADLKAALFFDSTGAAANAFQSGEVVIGAFNSAPAWGLHDQGVPLQFVIPSEGAWGGDVRLHLVEGAPHKELAEQFINFALTPRAAACMASKLYLGPAVKGTEVSTDVAKKLPWGETGSIDDLKMLDWWKINEHRSELVDQWNRKVVN